MSARLLILTVGYGEGHNAAARALAAACDARLGAGCALVVDLPALTVPRLNQWSRRAYLGVINGAPNAWRRVYHWLDRSRFVAYSLARLPGQRPALRQILAREQPLAIACTFPGYAYLLREMAREGELTVPFYNIVTDSISINSLWWRAGCAGWFLPNAESADILRRAGIAAGRLHVSGFPVQPFFDAHSAALTPPDLAAGATPRVLQIINSGRRHAAETAARLLRETDWEITCTVGRDDELRVKLERLAAGRSPHTKILGWTNEIPHLLMTHHVVVSKAGGATTQEALAARCPMIVNQVVPGQEEGNYELLRRHGVGALAETPAATLAVLRDAFADGGRGWRRWRAALEPLCRPAAAHAILDVLLAGSRPAAQSEPVPLPMRPSSVPA